MKVNVTFWAVLLCCCGLLMPTVGSAADLGDADLTCGDTGDLAVNGSTITINNLKIRNQGSATAGTFRVGYYLSTNTIISTNDHLIGTDVITSLAANGTSTQSFTIDLNTTDVPQGTYHVGIVIDDQGAISETNEENNNCFYSSPQVTVATANVLPNLTCASPGTLTINGTVVTITNAQVKNDGETQAGLSYIGFYLSEDLNFTTSDILIGSQLVSALQPHALSSESITVEVGNMAHIPSGTYYIGSIIDFDNDVEESNEADNNQCFFSGQQIAIGGSGQNGPDLTCFDNGYLAITDNTISINNLQIKNVGDAPAVASTVGYYLSTDEEFTTNDILIDTDYVDPLAPGQVSTESTNVNISTLNLNPGTYFVGIIVDHTNAVNESHETEEDITNNDQSNVCFFASPKLVMQAAAQKADLQCQNRGNLTINGNTLSLTNLTVKNAGNADARDSYVGYYLSLDTEFNSGDIILGTDYVSALTPGMSSTESFSIDLSTMNIAAGTYYFGSVVDYNNQVDESNEENNNDCFFDTPRVEIGSSQPQLADLSCESRGTLTINGTTITITNSIIKNTGQGAAAASVIGYYLSPNTSFTTSDILIGTINVSGLNSSASTIKTFSADLSNFDIPSGTYYVGFILDKDGSVEETNEDNNNDCFFNSPTVTIDSAPVQPDLTCMQNTSLWITGSQVELSNFIVKNVGNGNSVATKIGYYLSLDNNFTTADFRFGTDDIPALQPNGTSIESINIDVDNGSIPAGTYNIGVIIDFENNNVESNESNNVCILNQQVTIEDATPQLPDLICDSRGTLTVNGTFVKIEGLRIKNVGEATAGVSYVGYYLSTDRNFTTSDFRIGSDYINALGAWASSTESFSIDVANLNNIPPGTYYVGTIIDYQNNVNEANENNNVCFFENPRVTIEAPNQKADLTCLNRGYLSVNGTQINISNTQIKNISDFAAPNGSYVGYYLSTDTNFSTADFLIGTDYVGPLAGHSISTESFSVNVANSNVPAGTYYVGIIIDYLNQVDELSESNNICFFNSPRVTIGSTAKPDLTCVSPGYLSVNGSVVNLTSVQVKNIGNQTSASTKVGFYLSLDQNFTTNDVFLGAKTISALGAFASDTKSFSVNLSGRNIPSGTYYIGSIIDYQNTVTESDETNNICFINSPRININNNADKPDLVCDYRGNLSSSGSYLNISNVRIKNTGNGTAGASHIGYYLSADQNITTSDFFLGEDYVSSLTSWSSSIETISVDVNSLNIPAGTYFVGVVIDYKNEVDEKDETNNICFFESPRVTIGGGNSKPNLVCDDRGTLSVTGTNVNLRNLRIKNMGNGSAGSSVVGYYLSLDRNITRSDFRIGSDAVSSLASWGSSIEHFSKDVANLGIPAGTYYFGIIIDDQYHVTETDETDNTCFFETPRVTIGGGGGSNLPDLTCADNGYLVVNGSSLRINGLVVKNIGNGNAAPTRVGYYLSTDATITTADFLIGSDYVSALNSWASSTENFAIDVNSTTVPNGTYFIGAIIDYQDVVNEENETNNNLCDYNQTIVVNRNGGGGGGADRCATAETITCNQTISSNNGTGNSNNFANADYRNCHSSSSTFNAPDKLYKIDVANNSTLRLRLFNLSKDLDLFVFSECSTNPVCIAKSTNGNLAQEEITINNASGTYFIVVDGYRPSQISNFKLETICTNGGGGGGNAVCACPSPDVDEFCDDFETYNLGAIGPQSNCWTTYNVATEDVDQDGQVVSTNRDQKLRITNDQRPVLLLGNRTRNIYTVDMKVTVPTGNYVQINPVRTFVTGGYQLGGRILFIGDGRGLLSVNGNLYDFNYPNGQEFDLRITIALDGDNPIARFFINGAPQYIWQYNPGAGNNNQTNGFAGIEFRTDDGESGEFFIDDVQFNEIIGSSNLTENDSTSDFIGDLRLLQDEVSAEVAPTTLHAFPNPSTGQFITEVALPQAGNYRLDVIDINGKVIRSFTEKATLQQAYDIDLSQQPNGVYYVRLQTEDEVITKQMVLMK